MLAPGSPALPTLAVFPVDSARALHATCPLPDSQSRAWVRRTFGPGDYGWGTDIVTTTITADVPDATITVWTTCGVPTAAQPAGSVFWVTEHEGVETTLTLTPQVVTYTLIVPSTSLETWTDVEHPTTYETQTVLSTATLQVSSTAVVFPPPSSASASLETLQTTPPIWLTVATSTLSDSPTPTSLVSGPTATTASAWSDCRVGDEDEREAGLLSLTDEQDLTLLVAGIYVVGILISWNLWGLRVLLYPFKSFTVLVHEAGHVFGILLSGQPLHRCTIDPNLGGASYTRPERVLRPPGLFGGQVFSAGFGAVMVIVAFDTLASKYAAVVVMSLWIVVIGLQKNVVSMLNCVWPLALLIGVWFIEHARGLRFCILFLGVMSSFYVVWDTMDDFMYRKQNECCVVMLESNTAVAASIARPSLAVSSGAESRSPGTEFGFCRGQTFAPT
ncbi:hypothetical protein JCM3770_000399 [Rhodotorula araucariae]